jgi:hypothetical protein
VPLGDDEREQVIRTALDVLRHRRRGRLLEILRERLDRGDYPDDHEASLDEIAHALARAVDGKLREPER